MSYCPDCHRKSLKLQFDSDYQWDSVVRCPKCAYHNNLYVHLRLLFQPWNIQLRYGFEKPILYFNNDCRITLNKHRILTFEIESELEAAVSSVYRNIQGLNGLTPRILMLKPMSIPWCPICFSVNFGRLEGATEPTLASCEHFRILDTAYLYSIFLSTSLPEKYTLNGMFPIYTISTHQMGICEIKPRWGDDTTIVLVQPLTEDKKLMRKIINHLKIVLNPSHFTVVKAL